MVPLTPMKKPPRRKRKSDLTAASDVLQGLFEMRKGPMADSFQRFKLTRQWPEIVGETIGENTKPVSFYKGTLYIQAANSAWMQQLVFMADQIKENINKFVGKDWVKQVRFKLDDRV